MVRQQTPKVCCMLRAVDIRGRYRKSVDSCSKRAWFDTYLLFRSVVGRRHFAFFCNGEAGRKSESFRKTMVNGGPWQKLDAMIWTVTDDSGSEMCGFLCGGCCLRRREGGQGTGAKVGIQVIIGISGQCSQAQCAGPWTRQVHSSACVCVLGFRSPRGKGKSRVRTFFRLTRLRLTLGFGTRTPPGR